ncbi:MAG: hypothetical protein HC800_17655 [Phormidesmis sp. RL_2_1]|nr:hypothetical protein [Phormidesmis sp. RL_2_1]
MMSNLELRNSEITAARDMMFNALSDYSNHQLMQGVNAAAYIRRRECVWAIEQAIAMTYQMQGEWEVVGDRLLTADSLIRQDILTVLDKIETIDELDFLFPEVTRIYHHDLAAISAWKAHIDWYQELPSEEMKQLNESSAAEQQEALVESLVEVEVEVEVDPTKEEPAELKFYEEASQKFVPYILVDSLVFLFDPEERQDAENYIDERAQLENLAALNPQNLCKASPLTVANLYGYFAQRDESLVETETEEDAEKVALSHF